MMKCAFLLIAVMLSPSICQRPPDSEQCRIHEMLPVCLSSQLSCDNLNPTIVPCDTSRQLPMCNCVNDYKVFSNKLGRCVDPGSCGSLHRIEKPCRIHSNSPVCLAQQATCDMPQPTVIMKDCELTRSLPICDCIMEYEVYDATLHRCVKPTDCSGCDTENDNAKQYSRAKPDVHSASNGGVVYERWGRTECPVSATLVYEGFIAGGWHATVGNGAEYLCLPNTPAYVTNEPAARLSWLYSTEYETSDEAFPIVTSNYDAPCVVCHVARGSKLLMPASPNCPDYWILEYSGYLMSSADSNANNRNYVCVDGTPEVLLGSDANTDGAGLFFVAANCDNSFLPCLPYLKDVPLPCAVCTM